MSYFKIKETILEGLAILSDVYPNGHINRILSDEEVLDLYNTFHEDKKEVESFNFRVRKYALKHDKKDVINKQRFLHQVRNFLIDAELRLNSKGLLDY